MRGKLRSSPLETCIALETEKTVPSNILIVMCFILFFRHSFSLWNSWETLDWRRIMLKIRRSGRIPFAVRLSTWRQR